MNQMTVIARYNEDITWCKKLDSDIIIYNKGNDWNYDFPCLYVENFGREGETFVRFIIDFYDQLSNYDVINFLQGNPFDHCPQAVEIINKSYDKTLIYLSNSIHREVYNDDRSIFGFHLSTINTLLGLDHLNRNFTATLQEYDEKTDSIINLEHDNVGLYRNAALCTILGLDIFNQDIDWGIGAQYSVPVAFILNKDLEWWKHFHLLFVYLCKDHNEYEWTYMIERIWPLIWKHQT